MKITNIWKHLGGGVALCLFYVLAQLIGPIPAIIVSVVAWEMGQLIFFVYTSNRYVKTVKFLILHYLKVKGLDCIVDMLVGVFGFTALYILAGMLGILKTVTVFW